MRPSARGNESLDKGAAVPKFGDWDENNPSSADGYTHIFNQVREQRNNGGKATPDERSPYHTARNRKPTNDRAEYGFRDLTRHSDVNASGFRKSLHT
ncbi:RPM1-interacting protein 4 [Hibiscus syriacus]|uniref:RPM1-interacting protein 4 n=1 Tax=Hibiscus syriacus TaxID=106335 RepID=A0A6A3AE00_HIBSY|nr:RPM1-interacting protein 4 [Hibiscus syriacus]